MSLTKVDLNMIDGIVSPPGAYALNSAAALYAYENNAQMHIQEGELVNLVCDPSSGDDFQDMCKWISANHYRTEPQTSADSNVPSTALYLEIADGLHDVNTFVDVTENRLLDIRGTGAPDFISITGATFTSLGTDARAGVLYEANITLATALPDRVVPGFAVGGQNVQGDGGADCLNGGFIVESVAGNKLSLVVKFRNHGVAPTAFTTPDNTASLGLTPNTLAVPKATIRAQSDGWGTGASREGFLNAIAGGTIKLTNIGISYNGVTDAHDLIFISGTGSKLRLEDYVVLAGAGAFVVRGAFEGSLYSNRSFIGGDIYARTCAYLQGGAYNLIRSMVNSSYEGLFFAGANSAFATTQCVLNNASVGMRTGTPDSNINFGNSRLSRCANGLQVNNGSVLMDSNCSLKFCTTPFALNGTGQIFGTPVLANNTNSVITAFEYNSNGGVFYPRSGRAKDPQLTNVFVDVKSLTTGDMGTIAANDTLDLASTATSTPTSYYWLNSNDNVLITRSGTSLFQQGLLFQAYVTTASTQGTYVADGTTTVTVTMANTFSPSDSVNLEFLLNVGSILTDGTYTIVSATATEFTFTHGSVVTGEGRVSLDNGVITTRINNLTSSSFTPIATTVRFAVVRILTP